MNEKVVLLINKSEITAGTRGASLGPDAIMTAARKKGSFIFSEFPKVYIDDANHLLDLPTPYKFAKRVDGLETLYRDLDAKVSQVLKSNKFPLVLAGDHGSAAGTIAGIKSAFPSKTLGVVWIDAHADIHTPYTTPSGNIHGMPLSIALDDDNLECGINEVSEFTKKAWVELKKIGGEQAKLKAEHLAYIGVRDTEPEENAIIERLNIRNFTVQEVNQKGTEQVLAEIESQMAACDLIYVSFDVDSMDPEATSHGTGTPVKDGLLPVQAKELLVSLAKNPKTTCIEFVEVNPCLDEKINRMAEVAAELLEEVLEVVK
jgi:arginase